MLRTNLLQVLQHEAFETKSAFLEVVHFVKTHHWRQTARKVVQRKYWKWWILLAVVIVLSATLSAYHEKIATAIHPYARKIAHTGWTWVVPVILLFIVSFPPLFGHELILLVCGMIWGLWAGFAIAAAGTFIGELGTYVAFKYFFRERAAKLEESHIIYACCAKMMRDGGLPMLILVRFSAMPGHIVTAIQSCIGIGIWMYGVAAFVTLPKQFALVYLGKIFGDTVSPLDFGQLPSDQQSAQMRAQEATKRQQKKISFIVFTATIVATAIAAYIVWMRARAIRPAVVAEMEARKLAREEEEAERATARRRRQSRPASGSLSLGELKPPEFANLLKWNDSKPGLLMTPTKGVHPAANSMTSLGMSLNSPSLPHLPRYTTRAAADEVLLYGRPRSGTNASSVSGTGSLPVPYPGHNGRSRSPSLKPPEEEDYFGRGPSASTSTPSISLQSDATDSLLAPDSPPPSTEARRRQSEPNWMKQAWS